MRRITILIVALFLFNAIVYSQTILLRDSLIVDFERLVTYLEQTHPDPYSGFGGKVAFHQKANALKRQLSEKEYDIDGFCDLLSEFIANLHDGHTYLSTGNRNNNLQNTGVIPVSFTVIPNGIIVTGIEKGNEQYLGAKLLRINNVPINTLLSISSKYKTAENPYGAYLNVSYFGRTQFWLEKWIGEVGEEVTLGVEKANGKECEWKVKFISSRPDNFYEIDGYKPISSIKNNSYGFIDRDRKVMAFVSGSIMARENYEYCVRNGWNNSMSDVERYYKNSRKSMPADTTEALLGIPSFSESFLNMLNEMKNNGSETLIIDLRGNSGGWTPITLPTLYMMYGDKFLLERNFGSDCRVLSELYLNKINSTLEQFNKQHGKPYKIGDYIFEEDSEEISPNEMEEVRNNFIDGCMSATKDALRAQNGKAIYTPKNVFVVTDSYTFSAAFHYTFFLSNMGAKVAGVTSSQAPNTFMETTPFSLPYSRLNGSISNYMQLLLPVDDKRATSYTPDIEMTYNQYKSYQFNRDAIIMYLIESTGAKIVK